jgi:hypothetical protein
MPVKIVPGPHAVLGELASVWFRRDSLPSIRNAGSGRFGLAIVQDAKSDLLSLGPGDFETLWRLAFDRFADLPHGADRSHHCGFLASAYGDRTGPRIAWSEKFGVAAPIEPRDQMRRDDFL